MAFITFLMFTDTDGVFIYCYMASLLHEMGHLFAIYMCGDVVDDIVFDVYGILINKHENISYPQQIFILFAGPIANIILGIVFYFIPAPWCSFFSGANIVLAVFNLIPINGLDGGEILLRFLEYLFGFRIANLVSIAISVCALFPIAAICFYNYIGQKNNYSLIFVFLFLVISLIKSIKNQ